MAEIGIGTILRVPWTTGSGNILLKYLGGSTFEVSSDAPANSARVQKITFVTSKPQGAASACLNIRQLDNSDLLIDCETAASVPENYYNGGNATSDSGNLVDCGAADSVFTPQQEE